MKIEMNQFRDVFFEESAEHVAAMEAALLGLETSAGAGELLKQIFRSAHTIKGGSGMFGLDALGRFTHSAENLLDKMRNGAIQPSPPLVDLLLRSCDIIKALLVAAKSGDPLPAEMDQVMDELDRARQAGDPAPGLVTAAHSIAATPAPQPASASAHQPAAASAGQHIAASAHEPTASSTPQPTAAPTSPPDAPRRWNIRFTPAAESLRQGMEPLLVLRELASLGTVTRIEVDTKQLPSLDQLDPATCYLGWNLTLESAASLEAIEDVFGFVEQGREYTLTPATAAASAPPTASAPLPALPPAPAPDPTAAPAPLAPPSAASASSETRRANAIGESTIRVDVNLLDRIMNTVGELVLARNQILQFTSAVNNASLQAASQRLNLITTELQEGVMKTRMQPIGMVWGIMPRLVRDLAQGVGKHIRLEMDGAETELDRTLIEAIKDPLTHIVRNSCDHGIESPALREQRGKPAEGRLQLRAYHEGGQVIIEVTDDGGGIDPARVRQKAIERGLITPEHSARMSDREVQQLIFQPGFSTAEKVTGISGRGVGMDVVKTNIDRIGGAIDLASHPGKGTTVKLKIPLTLAIIPGLVVTSGGERFAIPQVSLLELVRLEGEACRTRIEYVHDSPVYRRRGTLLPLVNLNGVLKLDPAPAGSPVNIIVLQAEEFAFGLIVDDIQDTQEIVVKPLGKQLKVLDCYSGATIMGDGRVSLILDVMGIAQHSGILTEARAGRGAEEETAAPPSDRQTVLLFRAAGLEQVAVPLSLVARLEEFPLSRIEGSARRRVVQYRDRILPLVSLSEILNDPTAEVECAQDPLPVIVFAEGESGVGLIVKEILDVVDEEIRVRDRSQRPAVMGSAIVAGRVTDFLDLRPVLQAAGIGLNPPVRESRGDKRLGILLADRSPFQRALLRNDLEMAGYRVIEAGSGEEAAAKLEAGVDILAADFELVEPPGPVETLRPGSPRSGSPSGNPAPRLRFPLRQHAAEHGIGVLTLLSQPAATTPPGYEGCELQCKFDREAMLDSIARLAQAVQKTGTKALTHS